MMLELVQTMSVHPEEPSEVYDEALNDVNAIIMDMCISLGDTGGFDFRVSGFGDDRWPVDVATDLATVLEQLPVALDACAAGEPFTLDFLEQGVERRLEFALIGESSYEVTCIGNPTWNPERLTEEVRRDALLAMLAGLGSKFCALAFALLPEASKHPWFRIYADGVARHVRGQ